MKAFKNHRGLIAILDNANVDTDQIIPKQFLKKITRTGFGEKLFHDWRYLADGKNNPEFSLNLSKFKGASILVTRNNFGCGSSREHAVWAIQQDGFAVVIAPSMKVGDSVIPAFADIFRNNGFKNGLLTIELNSVQVDKIMQTVNEFMGLEATVNLSDQNIVLHAEKESSFHFDIDPEIKKRLIHGYDDISLTLQHEVDIQSFEHSHDVQI